MYNGFSFDYDNMMYDEFCWFHERLSQQKKSESEQNEGHNQVSMSNIIGGMGNR